MHLHGTGKGSGLAAWLCFLLFLLPSPTGAATGTIQNGKLLVDGQWLFLKTACPLANFAAEDLKGTVDVLVSKGYNNMKINLYWDHFDPDGDGQPNASLGKLNELIGHIHAKGIHASLSFETYNVGGGGVPVAFFDAHPDAQAKNSTGAPAFDGEYGTGKKVPSIFHPAYLQASRAFMKNVAAGIDTSKILYWETTVEPQYIGDQELDYSDAGKAAWQAFCAQEGIGNCPWPPGGHPRWHEFRAKALAEWIMGDAAAIREVAGGGALIAVDYLETGGGEMKNRNGDSMTFLGHLQGVNILQCNWHWKPGTNQPFDLAYQRANALKGQKGWAITEHMTINGADFMQANIASVLQHTLDGGNAFGWEIVNARNNSNDSFTVYNSDWSPKQTVAELDDNHGYWVSKGYGNSGQGYDGFWVGQDYPQTMESGEVAQVQLRYRNSGAVAWDTTFTRIGTTEPQDMASPFYDPADWLGSDRPTAVDGPTLPGQTGKFSFTLRAPEVDQPTEIIQHWGLVQDGVTWFGPTPDNVWFKVLVLPKEPEPEPEPEPDIVSPPDVVSPPEVVEETQSDLPEVVDPTDALPGTEVVGPGDLQPGTEVVGDLADDPDAPGTDLPGIPDQGAVELPPSGGDGGAESAPEALSGPAETTPGQPDADPWNPAIEADGKGSSGGGCQSAAPCGGSAALLLLLLFLVAGRWALRQGA
jgi:hypothetical protein